MALVCAIGALRSLVCSSFVFIQRSTRCAPDKLARRVGSSTVCAASRVSTLATVASARNISGAKHRVAASQDSSGAAEVGEVTTDCVRGGASAAAGSMSRLRSQALLIFSALAGPMPGNFCSFVIARGPSSSAGRLSTPICSTIICDRMQCRQGLYHLATWLAECDDGGGVASWIPVLQSTWQD